MAHKYYKGRFHPKNPQKYVGNIDNIIWRSSWEFRVMKFLDENSSILAWNSEETVIPYISPLDNSQHRYFPDFLVRANTKTGIKTMMWEVKPQNQSDEPKMKSKITKRYITEVARYGVNQSKWRAAKKFCDDRGWEFRVITENDLFGKSAK